MFERLVLKKMMNYIKLSKIMDLASHGLENMKKLTKCYIL